MPNIQNFGYNFYRELGARQKNNKKIKNGQIKKDGKRITDEPCS